jgi:phosphoribosylformimino-5-aminoimidazole carboxamide ribotide isomerase
MTTGLTLIPVIDLLGGQVVRGVRGDRKAYRPIVSALCHSSEPLEVARTLCDHCNTRQLYVADLDALMGGNVQVATLQALLRAMPELELWLDGGFADAAQAATLMAAFGADAARIVPVFGSESLRSRADLQRAFDPADPAAARSALSLDRRDGQRLDAAGCWDAPALWPRRVIVMTLERVGSNAGPDLETMIDVRRKAPGATLIGAGGIRTEADLAQAREAGANAWLVASALHDLQLPRVRR